MSAAGLLPSLDADGQRSCILMRQAVEAEENLPEISLDKPHQLLKYAETICYHMQNGRSSRDCA